LNKKIMKTKILLRQNWIAFSILLLWFLIHFIVFYISHGTYSEALQYTFYFKEDEIGYGHFYPIISGFLIFGLVLTLLTVELYRKYNPLQTCLALARSSKDHVVIIGYSHLGQRVREYLQKIGRKYVVIEEDQEVLRELIEREEAVVVKKPHTMDSLDAANIKEAKLVLTTKNDLKTLVIATDLIRDVNKTCRIISRCYNDSIARILEQKSEVETISTSKYACEFIMTEIKNWLVKDVLIIGCTNTARRLMSRLRFKGINYKVIERDEEKVADIIDEEPITIGDAKDKDLLHKVEIDSIDLILIMIDDPEELLLIADVVRSLNESCHLICRFFHEEFAEILEKSPFNALVISTSRHTLERLIKKGVFGTSNSFFKLD